MNIKKVDYFDFDEICTQNLTPTQERVYRCLLKHKNKNHDYSFPRQSLMAIKTGLNVKTIQRAIKVLVDKNFIEIEKMKAIIGNYNKYKLLLIPCIEKVLEKFKSKKIQETKKTIDFNNSTKKNIKINNTNSNKSIQTDTSNSNDFQNSKLNNQLINNSYTDTHIDNAHMDDLSVYNSFFSKNEEIRVQESNINKILKFTKITKISDKQKESLKEFDTLTINQTIARIKTGITNMPRTATLLIDKICDTAIGLGKFSDWQYKKYGLLKPLNNKSNTCTQKTSHNVDLNYCSSIQEKRVNKYAGYEDILGWYD